METSCGGGLKSCPRTRRRPPAPTPPAYTAAFKHDDLNGDPLRRRNGSPLAGRTDDGGPATASRHLLGGSTSATVAARPPSLTSVTDSGTDRRSRLVAGSDPGEEPPRRRACGGVCVYTRHFVWAAAESSSASANRVGSAVVELSPAARTACRAACRSVMATWQPSINS